ncbi:MAG TPA: type IV toxin-antitoxin system AbiEi family antitoxin [Nitrospinota bacterium]|nr:type IV toxin-antitoxin system AbiEi family antitoxin [Nitrospinota bacterium]
MRDKYRYDEVFEAALEAFRENFALPGNFVINVVEEYFDPNLRIDKVLQITAYDKRFNFCVEIKNNITMALIGLLKQHKERLPYPLLLATNHATDYIADQLKQNNIEFIDTAGNAYINQPPVFIFVKGNRPPDIFRQVPQKQAFKPTGLKVIFAFLCNLELVNKTYRDIATVAEVALGTIGWVIRDLKEMGYLLQMGKRGYKLINKEDLLNRWVVDYPEKLRPKLILGRFRGNPGWWEQQTLNYEYAQWGGEVAALKLTRYLKPQNITIYTRQRYLNDLLLEHRLRKDINGDIEILKRFWKPVTWQDYKEIVHPILIYADLMATGDQRNIETAKVIYEQNIVRYIRED